MIRRPPRSTRTDTLFPYTTLFRSVVTMNKSPVVEFLQPGNGVEIALRLGPVDENVAHRREGQRPWRETAYPLEQGQQFEAHRPAAEGQQLGQNGVRGEVVDQIGRESCRRTGWQNEWIKVVAVSLTHKHLDHAQTERPA